MKQCKIKVLFFEAKIFYAKIISNIMEIELHLDK